MKICIFTNHFYPEDFKVNDIAFELSKRGFEITVISAIPDYPAGRFYEGYSLFKRRREVINGVEIIRLPVIPRGKGGKFNLILNYLSYFLSSLVFTCIHSLFAAYDCVFVHLTSPFFIGVPAVLLKRRQHIPLVFWVLDLWPESLTAACGINNRLIINPLKKMVQYVYDNCDKILIGSQGFRYSICEKGDYNDRLVYFPNWAEDVTDSGATINVTNVFPFSILTNEDFVILFTGNLGEAQNIEAVLMAAEMTKHNQHIKWIFLGEGRMRQSLMETAVEMGLQRTVFFPGRFPLSSMPVFMQRADYLMVSLKNEQIFNLTVPSKMQFYMAQGKPILAIVNGDGAALVEKARCGYHVPAGDYILLAKTVETVILKRDNLETLGHNGKLYYEKHFQKKDRIEQLEKIILSYRVEQEESLPAYQINF